LRLKQLENALIIEQRVVFQLYPVRALKYFHIFRRWGPKQDKLLKPRLMREFPSRTNQ